MQVTDFLKMAKVTEVVITCKGNVNDPDIYEKVSRLLEDISWTAGADNANLKCLEPWNSVRVTFSIPREAAIRLQELARLGDDALVNLGILSVQIANGELFDLNAIRQLLQQQETPPPSRLLPQQLPQQSSADIVLPEPPKERPKSQGHKKKKVTATSSSSKMPPELPDVNLSQQPLPHTSSPLSSAGLLPPHMALSSDVSSTSSLLPPQPPMSSSAHKSSFNMNSGAMLSIGNIPSGIPSPHLGNLSKTTAVSGNMAISNSFSSVYSIAMSVGGSSRGPHQTPVLQSLPNLPIPQTPPGSSFPWNIGAKPPPFMTNRQTSGMSPWSQMYPGGSSLPTNLPGSIPSIGPIPSPSNLANSRQEPPPPQPKPKKKQVKKGKRTKKPPKDKIPSIPLPPPLMPPEPKAPPASETMGPPKPVGLPLPISMTPISPNTPSSTSMKDATTLSGPAPVSSQTQPPPRFPFNQAQLPTGGRSDVSMTSPLLVDLLQRDIPSTQFPLTSGESMKGTMSGPVSSAPHRMPAPVNQSPGHSAVTMHLPNTTTPQLGVVSSQMTAPRSLVQQPPMFRQPMQIPMRPPMGQQPTPGALSNTNMSQKLNQAYQQQAYPQVPFSPGTPGGIPQSSNRMPMTQMNFPHGSIPPFMMPHGVSQAGHSMQLPHPHSQGNWPVPPPSAMTTVPAIISSEAAFTSSPSVSVMRHLDVQSQRPVPKQRDSIVKSTFDEESALAGMTEAERDTFVAAAKIAQDSKPTSNSDTSNRGDSLSRKRMPSSAEQFANLPVPSESFSFPEKSLPDMHAVGSLAVSEPQQINRVIKGFSNPGTRERPPEKPSPSPSPSLTPSPSSFISHRSTPTDCNKSSAIGGVDGAHFMTSVPAMGPSRQTVSSNDLPPSSLSQVGTSKSVPASLPAKSVQQHGAFSGMPPMSFPSLPNPTLSSHVSEQRGSFPSSTTSVGSVSHPTEDSHATQNWTSGSVGNKGGDSLHLDSKRKMQSYDYPVKQNVEPALPPKALGGYSYDWPFNTIAPPTQSLSTEGLQFMARLAAIPQDSDRSAEKLLHPHQELQKPGKEDKPHLKALLNEISGGTVPPAASGATDGQNLSSRSLKRLSSEEKTERKRRKSSPRPSADQHTPSSQLHGKGDHPSGSLELPRVPTAEELSFNLQQARAQSQSLDLLKGASSYSPMPKTGPSSPRGKGRTKSSDHLSQSGIQHAEGYKSKPFVSVPTTTTTGAVGKTSGGTSKSSSKSKESRSRSKSPKASGSKSHKSDGSSFQGVTPAQTSSNVPFAGVHEFHPPPGLTIRGPAKPGPPQFQARKVPPQVNDEASPMSPTMPPYGPTPFQQPHPFPPQETQRKSPRAGRPVSPFASASALLSSFAMSAGKVPEFPVTKPGQSQSPLTSPSYVTSPPLQHLPVTSLPSTAMGASHSGIIGEGEQLQQQDDFKAIAMTPQGGHQPLPQFPLASQDPKLDHGFYQREPVSVAPGRIVQQSDGWSSNWTDAAQAETRTHTSVPNIPFGNPHEVHPPLWKPQATAVPSETERTGNAATLATSSGGGSTNAGTSFPSIPTSSFHLQKSNEETGESQPNTTESSETQRTSLASSVSSGIEDNRRPAGGSTVSATRPYPVLGMDPLSSSPDVPTNLASSYPDESNPYFYQPHRSPVQSEAQGKARAVPPQPSGVLNPKVSGPIASSVGDAGVQKSVIVVSSQKPNVTTIGVRKVGAVGHQQYSVPSHSQSHMMGTSSYETSQGYPMRPSNMDMIGRNGASNMPQTRVTKVIPITQENKLSWPSNKTFASALERDQSTTEATSVIQPVSSMSSVHCISEASSATSSFVTTSSSMPTVGKSPSGGSGTIPFAQVPKTSSLPVVSDSNSLSASGAYPQKESTVPSQSEKLEREHPSHFSQQQTNLEIDRMMSLSSTPSNVTSLVSSVSNSSLLGAKEPSGHVAEEKSQMAVVSTSAGSLAMTAGSLSSPMTAEHLTSTVSSTISTSSVDSHRASAKTDPLHIPIDLPTHQKLSANSKSKLDVTIPPSHLISHSSEEGTVSLKSSGSGNIHQDISVSLPETFDNHSFPYSKDDSNTGERSEIGASLDSVSDAGMSQDPLVSEREKSDQPVIGEVSQMPVSVRSSATSIASSLDFPTIASKSSSNESAPSQEGEANQASVTEEHQTASVESITSEKSQGEQKSSHQDVPLSGDKHGLQETTIPAYHESDTMFGMSSEISSGPSRSSVLQSKEGEEEKEEADVYGFKGCEEEDEPLDQSADDEAKDSNSALNQSERMDVMAQEGFGEHELDTDQDDGSLLEDDISMQRKNRSQGRSPVTCGQEAGQEGGQGSGSQDDDQDQPKTRKRSMRASGRDMYYGPIPAYKRRKPNQK